MTSNLINKQFLNDLKLSFGTIRWYTSKDNFIVPEILTHDNLLMTKQIDDSILNFYFKNTSKFLTDEEWADALSSGCISNRDRYLTPYPFIIYGAYFKRMDLIHSLYSVYCRKNKPFLNGRNNLKTFGDYKPYFEDYAEGFKQGYNEYDKNCIKPHLPMFGDKQDFINNLFDFITKKSDYSWHSGATGFSINYVEEDNGVIEQGFENGREQGEFYRAWSYILSNSRLFEPLFKTLQKDNQSTKKSTPTETKQGLVFSRDIISDVFDILKLHFEEKEHQGLNNLLTTGFNHSNKLYFMSNGNKLTDAFKQLIECNFITNCTKKELQEWVCDNFQFRNNKTKKRQEYNLNTVSKTISSQTEAPCKNPLFQITDNAIKKL